MDAVEQEIIIVITRRGGAAWIFILRCVFALKFNEWETAARHLKRSVCRRWKSAGTWRLRQGEIGRELVFSNHNLPLCKPAYHPPSTTSFAAGSWYFIILQHFHIEKQKLHAPRVCHHMRTREINPHLFIISYAAVSFSLRMYFLGRQYQLYKYWKQNAFPAFHSSAVVTIASRLVAAERKLFLLQ